MKLEKSQIGIQIKITLRLWESLTELLLNNSYNLLEIIVFVKRKSFFFKLTRYKTKIYTTKADLKIFV